MLRAIDADEAPFDPCLCGPVTNHRGIGASTDQQLDRLDEHRLSRTRFPRQCGETGPEHEIELFDHAEVLDVQFAEHPASFNHGGAPEMMGTTVRSRALRYCTISPTEATPLAFAWQRTRRASAGPHVRALEAARSILLRWQDRIAIGSPSDSRAHHYTPPHPPGPSVSARASSSPSQHCTRAQPLRRSRTPPTRARARPPSDLVIPESPPQGASSQLSPSQQTHPLRSAASVSAIPIISPRPVRSRFIVVGDALGAHALRSRQREPSRWQLLCS